MGKKNGCGNKDCSVSTSIDEETLTFGRGNLDDYGFWEHPCRKCAKLYEKKHPGSKVWPSGVKVLPRTKQRWKVGVPEVHINYIVVESYTKKEAMAVAKAKSEGGSADSVAREYAYTQSEHADGWSVNSLGALPKEAQSD